MVIKFRSIREARQNLKEGGFRFTGYGRFSKGELYEAPGLAAIITKASFKGCRVRIEAAA